MNSFAAIDFETANNERTSVCSVGVVIVKEGEFVDSFYSLIQPEPNYYLYWNTLVHGITKEDTCLKAVMRCYQMDYPDYQFYCTCRASRKHFGKLLPNHQLHTVAAACGYDLINHHNALADAEACAWIAREIL